MTDFEDPAKAADAASAEAAKNRLWQKTTIDFSMEPFSPKMFDGVKDELKGIFEIVFQDFVFAHGNSDAVPELLNVCSDTPAPTEAPVPAAADPVPSPGLFHCTFEYRLCTV